MIMYEAQCINKQVFLINDTSKTLVPDCKIFGAGGNSDGIIIADENRFWYLPMTTLDLSNTLDKVIGVCEKITAICDNLSNCSSLLDSGTTAAGIAELVPSVVVGTQMSADSSTTRTEIENIIQELKKIKSEQV